MEDDNIKKIKATLIILLLALLPAISGCLNQNQNEDLPEKMEFHTISSNYDDKIVYEYVPKSEDSASYIVSYNITEDNETIKTIRNKKFTNITSNNSIEIEITDIGFSKYNIEAKIQDEYNRTVYQGSMFIKRPKNMKFSFEEGMQNWKPAGKDLDNPPVEWSIKRSKNISTDGNTSIRFYLENVNDAGKIWIERPFYVKPNTNYRVEINYDLASLDWGDFNLFRIITGVVPENEGKDYLIFQGDTGIGNKTQEFKWMEKNYEFNVKSSPKGELYAMIGIWGNWETTRMYYIDNVTINFEEIE